MIFYQEVINLYKLQIIYKVAQQLSIILIIITL